MNSKLKERKRGLFILIEGLDRAGKSTQCSKLVERFSSLLSSDDVELVKFPNRDTPIGRMIDNYLKSNKDSKEDLNDQAVHLLFSANRWEAIEDIKKKILNGKIIIVDRYVYSGVAYSAAKGLDFDWCLAPDLGLPKPDLTFFLNISPSEATRRSGYGIERYEESHFQQEVRRIFEIFINKNKTNLDWKTILVDGKDIETVSNEIWSNIEGFIPNAQKDLLEINIL